MFYSYVYLRSTNMLYSTWETENEQQDDKDVLLHK